MFRILKSIFGYCPRLLVLTSLLTAGVLAWGTVAKAQDDTDETDETDETEYELVVTIAATKPDSFVVKVTTNPEAKELKKVLSVLGIYTNTIGNDDYMLFDFDGSSVAESSISTRGGNSPLRYKVDATAKEAVFTFTEFPCKWLYPKNDGIDVRAFYVDDPMSSATDFDYLDIVAPPKVTGLDGLVETASIDELEMSVEWDPSYGAEGYIVERRLSTQTDWETLLDEDNQPDTDVNKCPSTGLIDRCANTAAVYYYRVRAYTDDRLAAWSDTVKVVTPGIAIPVAPARLNANVRNIKTVRLSWIHNTDGEAGFKIERRKKEDTAWEVVEKVYNPCDHVDSIEVLHTAGKNSTGYTDGSVTLSTLLPGVEYEYRVRAYNRGGFSAYSNIATARPYYVNTPSPPTNLKVRAAGSAPKIRLAWRDASYNETGFKIVRRESTEAVFDSIAVVGADVTSYVDADVDPGKTYYYQVQAYNPRGASDYTNPKSAMVRPVKPEPPFSFVAEVQSSSEIHLRWKDASENEDGFSIERGLTPRKNSFSFLATVGPDTESYADTGLLPGTTYYYRIRSYISDVFSDYATDVPSARTAAPSAPANLRGSASSEGVALRWKDKSDYEAGFGIGRKLSTDSNYAVIDSVDANTTAYTDDDILPRTTYHYRVWAHNAAGISSYSNTAEVRTRRLPVPEKPSSLTAQATSSSQIRLRWTDNADDELGFKIQRRRPRDSAFTVIDSVGANVTEYTDSGLRPGQRYLYRIRAYNRNGSSGISNRAEATTHAPPPPPSAPSSLSSTAASASRIDLGWKDNSDDETGFKIERKLSTEADNAFSQIGKASENATSYSDTGLSPSTAYVYRVRAYNDNGNSSYSGTASATTSAPPPPSAPSSLSATAASASRIDLSWTDNADDETGFKIERRLSTEADNAFSQIGKASENATSYSDTGLSPSTAYVYRVRAYNDNGDSGYSGTASATTSDTSPTAPAAPSSLSATAASASRINLTWTDNSDDETGFKIERRLTSEADNAFSQIDTASANAESYTDGSLSASTDYTYRVRAYNALGNSSYSGKASATTHAPPPAAPSSLTATAKSASRIDLGWKDASNNETGFKIERRLTSEADNAFSQIDTASANATSYTDGSLSASTDYTYRVRAYNALGNSSYSGTASATTHAPPPPPAAPSSLSATAASASRIDLGWTDNSDDETGFKIERKLSTEADNAFSQIGKASANDTTYADSGLSPSTAYVYRVRAYNDNGDSGYSGTARATTPSNLPSAPSSLSASATSASKINLTWTDNADNETGFKIERKLTSEADNAFSQIGTTSVDDTTYTDSGLEESTGYTYRVRAYNDAGNSSYSGTASATTHATIPSAPSSLSATAASASKINLTWTDNADNETGFKIERRLSTEADNAFSQVGTASENATSYSDTGLSASTGYTYRVRAYNAAGNSGYSGKASATTSDTPPAAPSSLTATAKSSSRIDLGWKDASSNETGFKIERRLSSQTDASFSQIGTASANAESYTDGSLSASTGYTYRVRAYNALGNSSYSGTASATTHAPPPPPAAPSSLSATAASSSKINLSWTDNSDDETGFKIERKLSTEADASFSQIGTASANATSYSNTGLSPSTAYVYRVRAYNANGNSGYSGTAKATTRASLPSAPSSLSASATSSSKIKLTWTDNADNETGFKIERRLSSQTDASFSQIGTASANATSYTNSGLSANTGYTYRVRAYNSGGNSGYSGKASATTDMTLPSTPSSLSASATSSSKIKLTWTDNADNETGFKIERRLSSQSNASFSQIGTASANATSYTDSGLSASTGYTYRVRAYNSAGNSSYSGTASATTKTVAPSAPSSLTATAKSASSISLSWKDTSNNETGFKIERRLSSQSNASFSQIGTASANAESYTDSGRSASTRYTYRVRAYNSAGNSGYSGTASATTHAPPPPPSAPSSLSASAASSSKINLSWTDNSDDETGFKIERRLSTSSSYSQIGTTSANDTDYSDTGLSPSTTYVYRVRAYNRNGNSSYSGTARATTHSNLPKAPSSLSATAASSSKINLSWSDNSDNESGFKIERKLSSASSYSQIGTASANAESYSDTGLDEGTGYTYRVRAYNSAGNSSYSATASATTRVTPPSAPSGLSATATSSSQIKLTWTDNADNESGFKIERKPSSGADSSFRQVGTASANATSYTNGSLSASTGYTYRVRAYNSAGNSSYSGTASATTKTVAPSAPSSLTATAKSASSISLSWKDTSNNETGFKIERKPSTSSTYKQIGTASANAESYTDSGLSASTKYTYRVRSYNSAGNSGYSGTASATTKAPSPPAAPSGLYAEILSSTSVRLSWIDNSNDESGFKIERRLSTESDSDFSQIGTTSANDTEYDDTGLSSSTTYIYRVRAYNAGGNSSYSGTDRAVTSARAVAVVYEYALEGSHPNPFREHAKIVYALPEVADVRLEIFNILGQRVRTLIDAQRPPGRHEIPWDGRDDNGRMISSGVYICRMTAGDFIGYRKMTFLK